MIDLGRLKRMIEGIGSAPMWERSRPVPMHRGTVVAMARELLAARELERATRELLGTLRHGRAGKSAEMLEVERVLDSMSSSRVVGD